MPSVAITGKRLSVFIYGAVVLSVVFIWKNSQAYGNMLHFAMDSLHFCTDLLWLGNVGLNSTAHQFALVFYSVVRRIVEISVILRPLNLEHHVVYYFVGVWGTFFMYSILYSASILPFPDGISMSFYIIHRSLFRSSISTVDLLRLCCVS